MGIVVALVLVVFVGKFVDGGTKLPCQVISVKTDADMLLIGGEFDAGFSVNANVKNTGDVAALFKVVAKLSTSEGNFERTQDIVIFPDQVERLKYGFHEPTINAGNVQGRVSCRGLQRYEGN